MAGDQLAGDITLSIVSVGLLITAELSRNARAINLKDIASEQPNPPGSSIFPFSDVAWLSFPKLGRFMFFHCLIFLILSGIFWWIAHFSPAPFTLRFHLGGLSLLLWFIFPIINVTEYDEIMSNNISLVSIYYHIKGVLLTAIFLFYSSDISSFILSLGLPIGHISIPTIVFILLMFYGTGTYLNRVQYELNQCSTSV